MGSRAGVILSVLVVLALCLTLSAGHFCGDDNCFELLKVTRKATKAEIRRSYRRLSQTMHPDKRPGVEGAVEEFRRIGAAYETLLDDAKRAKYEDFMDNPLKYPEFLTPKYHYAPKTNGGIVFVLLIGLFTAMHWLQMNYAFNSMKVRAKESVEFKRKVSKLVKQKLAPNKESAADMIDLYIGPEPHWTNLFIVQAAYIIPVKAAKYAMWSIAWTLKYKLLKKEKSPEDKLYLVQKNMQLDQAAWDAIGEDEKKEFIELKLDDADECDEYLRLKRIQLNKAGKLKKKKKHTPIPYSEVEEVNM